MSLQIYSEFFKQDAFGKLPLGVRKADTFLINEESVEAIRRKMSNPFSFPANGACLFLEACSDLFPLLLPPGKLV